MVTKFKIFETYYNDLSPYEYGFSIPGCVNIGWLDIDHDFEKGYVPDGFIDKLKKLPILFQNAGYHFCQFCERDDKGMVSRDAMSSNIKMSIGDGVVYLTPSMIVHYVRDHHYKPPQEFIDSVMKMENMSDADAHKHVNMLLIKHLKGL
jgi:hypothetical protein